MGDISVRAITDDEVLPWMQCVLTGFFGDRLGLEDHLEYYVQRFDPGTRLAAFEDGVLCGTTRWFSADLSVPGGRAVPMGGVSGVTVLPTHRRRGHLMRLMEAQLAGSLERGEVATMLIAAEWPIYGRFGYGVAVDAVRTVLDARTARFLDDRRGAIELVDAATLRAIAPAVFDAHRLTCPGAITRGDKWWDEIVGLAPRPGDEPSKKRVFAVHRDDSGEPDGYLMYTPEESPWVDNRPVVSVNVSELITTTAAAYRDLWRFLTEIDWVAKVEGHVRPVDEPLRHFLVDGRAATLHDRSDHMWVRVLDVPAALSARRYTTADQLVLEVVDDSLGRGGRFALDGGPDGASCTPTTTEPDVVLPATAVGSTYLGGSALARIALAGGVEEHTPGAIARYDAMFLTPTAPWATTGF